MATIKQALDVLKKAGSNVVAYEDAFSYKTTITIEIPFGTSWFEEIEDTKKMVDVYTAKMCKLAINTIYGCSSQAKQTIETYKIPEVREIRYNGPATIIFWEDNTKTVVKMQPGEECYDPDKAFAMAVCKKLFGNKFNRHLAKAQKAFFNNIVNTLETFSSSLKCASEGKKGN
nr:MAG TPA: hypothetical protein [Caudoviricetes sp.]